VSYLAELPFEWGREAVDWFNVQRNEEQLDNPYRFTSTGYKYKTVLRPGEQVTLYFHLPSICRVPKPGFDRLGRYVVTCRLDSDRGDPPKRPLFAKPLSFSVVEKAADTQLGVRRFPGLSGCEIGPVFQGFHHLR
jgi:hypothetical protein